MGLLKKGLAPVSLLLAGLTYKMLNVNFVVSQTQEPVISRSNADILAEVLTYDSPLGTISYRKIGSGTPAVLLHDAACYASGADWLPLAALLAENKYEVYIPDLPACGASATPETDCTCLMYMTFLENFIHTVINKKTDVICLGLTAGFVLPLTQMHPEYLSRITMINPSFQADISLREGIVKKLIRTLLSVPKFGNLLYKIRYSNRIVEEEVIESFYYNAFKSPARFVTQAQEAARNGSEGRLALYKALLLGQMDFNVTHILKAPRVPLRAVFGEKEPHAAERAADIQAQNPDIPVTILPGTRHMPQLEEPEALLKELLR